MINMVEPRGAADLDDVASSDSIQDGELTTLIRRWMAAGSKVQDRVRRESMLTAGREAVEPANVVAELIDMGSVAVADVEPESVEPESVEPESVAPEALYAVGAPRMTDAGPDDLIELAPQVDVPPQEPPTPVTFPPLPQRTTGAEAEQVHRVALLIDARRVSADVATALLHRLAERGSVNVCRAYADWNRADLGDWVGQLRREGLHSFHHFSHDDDQALVAMAIDAVDIARDAAVDEVVIAGDLTSALPLVHRLHAAGVRVVAVGSAHTPHDVRAACHEFIDTSTIDGTRVAAPVGRHRA